MMILNLFGILLFFTYVPMLDNIYVPLYRTWILSDHNFNIITNSKRIYIGPYNAQRHKLKL